MTTLHELFFVKKKNKEILLTGLLNQVCLVNICHTSCHSGFIISGAGRAKSLIFVQQKGAVRVNKFAGSTTENNYEIIV